MNMSRYAVLGQPVRHSQSPRIHQLFAEQTGQRLSYEAIEVAPADFDGFVRAFFDQGGSGLNITVPHKQAAFALADTLTARGRRAAAVNTLWQDEAGRLCADNTDGAGLVRDLETNLGLALTGKAILMVGAGGAARGALPALLARQPGAVTLLNRTLARAEAIQQELADLATIQVADYQSFGGGDFDLIINATSLSLSGELPPLPAEIIAEPVFCYDMVYGDKETAFLAWARSQGAGGVADGLGMLVEQAAEAFHLWRGVRPDTRPVMATLRQ